MNLYLRFQRCKLFNSYNLTFSLSTNKLDPILKKYTYLDVIKDMISIPLLKSSRFCSMNISGSTDRGLVSKQDMNISSTFSSTLGTFEKGLS